VQWCGGHRASEVRATSSSEQGHNVADYFDRETTTTSMLAVSRQENRSRRLSLSCL
jgi:hypothetical protein